MSEMKRIAKRIECRMAMLGFGVQPVGTLHQDVKWLEGDGEPVSEKDQ